MIVRKRRISQELWFDTFPVRPECRAQCGVSKGKNGKYSPRTGLFGVSSKMICLQGVLIGLLCSDLAWADNTLSHDPFARPARVASVQGNAVGATPVEEMPGNPKLTAVMIAGKNSLATVDGVVMKLGDERDGYRLVKVRDHKAIFRQGKKRVVLKMEMPSIKLGQ